jgi:cytoskeletal protein RodZ
MSVGILLRQAREAAGFSVERLATKTNLRPAVIEDLENDNFSSAGGLAYARGHIRSISRVLKIDPDLLVNEFNAMHQEFDRPMIDLLNPNNATSVANYSSRFSYKSMRYAAAAFLALLIIVPTGFSFRHSSPGVSKKSTAIPASTTPVAEASTSSSLSSVNVLAASGTSWLSVTDSAGNSLFSGNLQQGATQTFDDSQLITMVLGNAGAVDLNVNGKDIGAPGGLGEVVHLQFGPGSSAQG